MTDRQLGVVLLWSAANSREPGCLSIAEAVALYNEQEAAREAGGGKAPTPAEDDERRRFWHAVLTHWAGVGSDVARE